MQPAAGRFQGGFRKAMCPKALVLAIALASLPLPPHSVSAVPTVSLLPDSVNVGPGELVDLQLWINADADTFSNFNVVFSFDPAVVTLAEALEGSLYVTSGFQTWFVAEEESLGTWEVFDTIFPAGTFLLAPGELAVLRFEALAEGASLIAFDRAVVTDIERFPIDPLASEGGLVIVEGTSRVDSGMTSSRPSLGPPLPNPARRGVSLRLSGLGMLAGRRPRIEIRDIHGRAVRRVGPVSEDGLLRWDGRDAAGRPVPSGMYFLRLEASAMEPVRKVLIIR